jgi:hypothetical protein
MTTQQRYLHPSVILNLFQDLFGLAMWLGYFVNLHAVAFVKVNESRKIQLRLA